MENEERVERSGTTTVFVHLQSFTGIIVPFAHSFVMTHHNLLYNTKSRANVSITCAVGATICGTQEDPPLATSITPHILPKTKTSPLILYNTVLNVLKKK